MILLASAVHRRHGMPYCEKLILSLAFSRAIRTTIYSTHVLVGLTNYLGLSDSRSHSNICSARKLSTFNNIFWFSGLQD